MIERNKVIELIREGLTNGEIANKLGCGRTTIWRIRNETQNETNNTNETIASKSVSKSENETKQNETISINETNETKQIEQNETINETKIPTLNYEDDVPKGCKEWKRRFPNGEIRHYVEFGTAGIEKGYENTNKETLFHMEITKTTK